MARLVSGMVCMLCGKLAIQSANRMSLLPWDEAMLPPCTTIRSPGPVPAPTWSARSLSLSLSLSLSHTHSLSSFHTRTHTHTPCLSLPLSFSLSLTHTHTHTHTRAAEQQSPPPRAEHIGGRHNNEIAVCWMDPNVTTWLSNNTQHCKGYIFQFTVTSSDTQNNPTYSLAQHVKQ